MTPSFCDYTSLVAVRQGAAMLSVESLQRVNVAGVVDKRGRGIQPRQVMRFIASPPLLQRDVAR